MRRFGKAIWLAALAALAAGCEVQPSDPETTPVLTIFEVKRGRQPVVFTTDPDVTPVRTACSDGRMPDLVAGRPDDAGTWNDYYVLEPGQTEVEFLMVVRSRSGVSSWILDVDPGFDVIDPPTPRLSDRRSVFGFDLGGRFYSSTIRSMTLRLERGAVPSRTRTRVTTILTTGGGRTLESTDRSWTLIAAC